MKLGDFITLVNSVVAFFSNLAGIVQIGCVCNLSLDHLSLIRNSF